jgi:hypothetical protein
MHFLFYLFSICTFALLKIAFRKIMVDLKSCDMKNFVPNSSLTYNTRNVGEPVVVSRGSLSNLHRKTTLEKCRSVCLVVW